MSFAEYDRYDGLGLAELVRTRQVSASELLEEALARTTRANPSLNAVVFRADELARGWAQNPAAGPFQGVPLLLKDILGVCEGMPTRMASRAIASKPSRSDAELVARYRRAGFVPFGKTNAPELGLLPITDSALYGPARNPWNLAHTPGGSSGGSAAAVAAGIVPVAHANDGGGSIRIPAACCGLVGLKPTRGRNSLAPGSDPSGLVCEHVLTRTVRDSAAALDATAGFVPGDFARVAPPEEPFVAALERPLGSLKVAVLERDPRGEPYAPEHASALRATADKLSELGHEVSTATLEIDAALLSDAFTKLWYSNAAVLADGMALLRGAVAQSGEHDATTWAMVEAGRNVTASQYQIARLMLDGMTRRLAQRMRAYDVILSPTLSGPALPLGHIDVHSSDVVTQLARAEAFVAYAPIANAAGLPAISLPLYTTAPTSDVAPPGSGGLPIGMQLMAAAGEEALLLRLARQLEQALPWSERRPIGAW
ncbi:MAG: amidase [Polyangiales bacterium]